MAFSVFLSKHNLDVGQNTRLRDGDTTKELVQLLVVAGSELQVTRNNTRLVVTGCVNGQLQNFSRIRARQRCTSANSLGI